MDILFCATDNSELFINGAKSDRELYLVPYCFLCTLMISQQTLILKYDSLRMTVFVTVKLRIQRTH